MIRRILRKILPQSARLHGRAALEGFKAWRQQARLTRMRQKLSTQLPGSSQQILGRTLRITDGSNFYMQFKDEFIRRIYHFEARRSDPLIIDGGGNIGMSVLYFKHTYPKARVICFEPDPAIFRLLQENVTRNGLQDVTLINAGLGAETGLLSFVSDGAAGGKIGAGGNTIPVRVEKVSSFITEPVDFLKLNIEGQELPVLQELAASGKLKLVRELVMEYHGWPNGLQALGDILNLLDRQGYRYLVHDFDTESCPDSKPPFHWTPQTVWFCLVYARQEAAAN